MAFHHVHRQFDTDQNFDNQIEISVREPNPKDFLDELSQEQTTQTKEKPELHALSEEELTKLYRRLPPIQEEKDDKKEFSMRQTTLPAPKTGSRVLQEFPPKNELEKPNVSETTSETEELKVLRYLPEGKVKMAPHLSVTFNHPMISLSSIENVEKQEVPIKIKPHPKGKFKWIGTKTILFQPEYRFPMATEYEVTIPAGTTSQNGKKMKNDFSFKFSTPPPSVEEFLPSHHQVNNQPICFFQFDQAIDKEKALQAIKLVDPKQNEYPLQMVTEDYVRDQLKQLDAEKKLPSLYHMYQSTLTRAKPERSIWFTVKKLLPLSTRFTLIVGPNVPSLEGPLPSIHSQSFNFSTYGPMKYISCYPTDNITPNQLWTVSFSNEIELESFTDDIVTVNPPLPDLHITPSGSSITIHGRSKGRTNYTVTISNKLQDVYGQYLEKDVSVQFNVGNAEQALKSFASKLITLDPTLSEKPTFSVVSCNIDKIRVVLLQVHPSEYLSSRFGSYYHRERGETDDVLQYVGAGKIVIDEIVSTNGKPDEPIETFIDLERALQHKNEKLGQIVVYVEPEKTSWHGEWNRRPFICTWIQVTKLAIDAFETPGRTYCFSNSLVNGASIPGVTFTLDGKTVKSDENGMAILEQCSKSTLIASLDKDCSFIPHVNVLQSPGSSYLGFFFDDRKIYKPKETVNVKGIIRLRKVDKGGTFKLLLPKAGTNVQYLVTDSRGNKFNEGQVQLNEFGSFALKFDLPDNINLGTCMISFKVEGTYFSHRFSCQEFRTPEYSVKSDVPPGPHIVNGTTIVTTTANYYSGGGLSGADIHWNIQQQSANYSPPGWNGFVFQEQPELFGFHRHNHIRHINSVLPVKFSSKTDSSGVHRLCIEFKETDREFKKPVTITAASNVMDINRQMISASTRFLVHPSTLYVGIKNSRGYAKPKEPLPIEFIVTDIDGVAVEDVIIKITITKQEHKRKGYKWFTEDVKVKDDVIASKDKPVTYNLVLNEGGKYSLKAEISDKQGLINHSKISIFVQGGRLFEKTGRSINKERVTLIPDKLSYEPGDTADVLIQSPFDGPSEGVAYFISDSVIHHERFTLDGVSHILQIPIKKEYIPELKVFVYIVGKNNRVDESGNMITDEKVPKRPAYASGEIKLSIPPNCYDLSVKVTPAQQYVTPGTTTEVVVSVQNENKPIEKSEVTLIVVDEAVLSLTGYSLSNPLHHFHKTYYGSIIDKSLRSMVYFKDWKSITFSPPIREDYALGAFDTLASNTVMRTMAFQAVPPPMPMMAMKSGAPLEKAESEPQQPAIAVRSNFSPLAAFESHLITNEEGIAKATIKLPDNLTRYRIMAIALYDSTCYGLGESFIVANLPLMIRPSPPRFLNFGDKCNVSVVLQNQTNKPLEINVAMRASNLLLQDNTKAGYKLTLAQSQRVEVDFPVETQNVGIARIQFGAEVVNGDFADAAEVKIPIWTPATTEAFATYGEIDTGSIVQPITAPDDVFTQFGGLKITTSSTALQSLTDAFFYLQNYQYDGTEHIASKLLSIVALEDILSEFKAPDFPKKEVLKETVENGLTKLYSRQKYNGAFGFWTNHTYTSPYVSIFVALCLARVKAKGYNVRDDVLKKSQNYLMTIENHTRDLKDDSFTRNTLHAMALYVLTELKIQNNIVYQKAKQLFNESGLDKISMEGLSWIAYALYHSSPSPNKEDIITKIIKYFANRVNETPETANFITSYGETSGKMVMLHSNRRTDAIILETLMSIDNANTLIPKIVKGLLAHRKKGRWSSTQENCYILLALAKYFQLFESQTPDFVARIWLGNGFVGEQTFKGRNIDENIVTIPMNYIISEDEKTKPLLISKEGKGRMYYRIGMDYAPKDLKMPPKEYGFIIERTYESVTDPEHVKRDKDGIWHIKSGEMVRVRLTICTNSRRYHIAVVDKLPGGLEAMNPELRGTASIPSDPKKQQDRYLCFYGPWYEHQNIRDERVEAFTSLLWDGVYEYSYVARATTLGKFVVPPAKVEEMYAPELFGTSKSDFVIVE